MISQRYAHSLKGISERRLIQFMGVGIDALDTKGLEERIREFTEEGGKFKVFYANTDCMLLGLKDAEYRQALNNADLVYADGIGVVLGARFWGHKLPGRSTAADFFPHFCKKFAEKGLRIYLLGGKEGVAEEAAENLIKTSPGLKIAGTHHGYFNRGETKKLIAEINSKMPDILVVGFGAPYQEKWIEENSGKIHARVFWGVGGLFDFLSGRTWRGPQWLLDNGFEWLCRLIAEPRRLWRRYLIGNVNFLMKILWYRFSQRKWKLQ